MRKYRRSSAQADTGSLLSLVIVAVRSSLIAIVLSLLCFLIFAIVMKIGNFEETLISPGIQVIRVLSITVGGVVAARSTTAKGWLVGALSGILYMVWAIFISLLFGGGISLNSLLLSDMLLGLIAGLVGGMIGINLK